MHDVALLHLDARGHGWVLVPAGWVGAGGHGMPLVTRVWVSAGGRGVPALSRLDAGGCG